MKNYKLIKRMGTYTLIGTLMLTNPLVVEASDKKYEEKKIEWLNKAKSLGKKAVEYSSKAEEKVFDTMRGIELYDADKIWLITDTPNLDPNESRDYYFVNGSYIKAKKTSYYDKYNHKVKADSPKKAYATIQSLYFIGADTDKSFMATDTIDYQNNTVSQNYVDFTKDYSYDTNLDVTYGRILDWQDWLPESERKDSYSLTELRDLLDEYFNNLDYSLDANSLNLRK